MLSPKVFNIILYVLTKYIVFYTVLAVKNSNYYFFKVNEVRNGEDLFYYLWMLLFLPAIYCLAFLAPLYFTFKVKQPALFTFLIGAIILAEYFVYVYFTSDKHIDMNGVYNGVLSLLFLLIFFYRHINRIFNHHTKATNAAP